VLFEQGGRSLSEDNGVDVSSFAELALAPELCQALSALGYEEPTPIQRAAIPPLLAGRDLVGMLKAIERATGRPIAIEKLPTVADLRAKRMELTRAALRQIVLEDDLDAFRAVIEPLGDEFGIYEVALAAVKLAGDASGTPRDEEELPEVDLALPDDRGRRPKTANRGQRRGRPAVAATTRLFVGTGRSSGVQPKDLVGVIARKSYLSGQDIGAIEIADRFSLVEVPETAADDVVAALRQVSIKGRKTTIRREHYRAR
jgi:ATP-dependent RNA helicase DeaD